MIESNDLRSIVETEFLKTTKEIAKYMGKIYQIMDCWDVAYIVCPCQFCMTLKTGDPVIREKIIALLRLARKDE
jgi:hypothetical protein